jgi:hypothetical protein
MYPGMASGEHHHVAAGRLRLVDQGHDGLRVSLDRADVRIHLSDADPHGRKYRAAALSAPDVATRESAVTLLADRLGGCRQVGLVLFRLRTWRLARAPSPCLPTGWADVVK